MIEGKGLTKSYYRHLVIDHVDIRLPRHGMIGIVGPSGSGKSTLLKVIAGLLEFDGSLRVQELLLQSLDDLERLVYRQERIGLLYQSCRLFERETVAWNIALPLSLAGNFGKQAKARDVKTWLSRIGLEGKGEQLVGTLSGGEKQRVALARALIRLPRIILADEPTAALDEENKQKIIWLLQSISRHRLVIIVSHDEALIDANCETIFRMNDGCINGETRIQKENIPEQLTLRRIDQGSRGGALPWRFCLHHAIEDMKRHKWRHFSGGIMLSIALLGTGVGISLVESVASRMEGALITFAGEAGLQITAPRSLTPYLDGLYGAEHDSVAAIQSRYPQAITDIGVGYRGGVAGYFPDREEVFLINEGPIVVLPSFQASHFSEFLLFHELGKEDLHLQNDEIALALPETDLAILARTLRVAPSEEAINARLMEEDIMIGAGFCNDAWGYEDEQMWRLRRVYSALTAHVLHSSARFNEFVFETSMRFPVTYDLEGPREYPWVLRKYYTLLCADSDVLMEALSADLTLERYRFDHVSSIDLASVCPRLGRCAVNRIGVFLDPQIKMSLARVRYIQRAEPDLADAIIGTRGGYLIYPEAMLAGFAHETYFSASTEGANQVIDWLSDVPSADGLIEIPPFVVRGTFKDQSQSAVRLRPFPSSGFVGVPSQGVDQLAISSKMARTLYQTVALGEDLYITTRFIVSNHEGRTISEFITIPIRVTAIVESERMELYQSPLWSLSFFRDRVGINGDLLRMETAYFEGEESALSSSGKRIKGLFPDLAIAYPNKVLKQTIDGVAQKINLAIIALASVSGANAILLATFVIHLSWLDMGKDRRLLFELGAAPSQIERLIVARIGLIVFLALVGSYLQLAGVTIMIDKLLNGYFMSSRGFKVPVTPLIIMTMLALTLFFAVWIINRITLGRSPRDNI